MKTVFYDKVLRQCVAREKSELEKDKAGLVRVYLAVILAELKNLSKGC